MDISAGCQLFLLWVLEKRIPYFVDCTHYYYLLYKSKDQPNPIETTEEIIIHSWGDIRPGRFVGI
jgi:hypothetical protein